MAEEKSEMINSIDEFELRDVLFVIWKKKIIIIICILISMVIAAIISMLLPKEYQIAMKVRPGYVTVGSEDMERSLRIKSEIDANAYDKKIGEELRTRLNTEIPQDIKFKVKIPEGSSLLAISLEVTDIPLGMEIMQLLYSIISGIDEEIIETILQNFEDRIQLERLDLKRKKLEINSRLQNVKVNEDRISALSAIIDDAKKNNENLIQERKKLFDLSGKNEKDSLAVLLYTNTIQQTLQTINDLMRELNETLKRRDYEAQEVKELNCDELEIRDNIVKLEKQKKQIKKMELLVPPEVPKYPIRPQKKIIVLLTGVVVSFLAVIIVLFVNYLDLPFSNEIQKEHNKKR